VVWLSWPTSASAYSRISSSQKTKTGGRITEILHLLCRAENTQREKALRQAEIDMGMKEEVKPNFRTPPR
jgi:hypothetical protein